MSSTRLFTVDKFLGLNESADSTTELKMGEASKAENFYITDGYNIRRRPGVKCKERCGGELLGFRTGKNNNESWFLTATSGDGDASFTVTKQKGAIFSSEGGVLPHLDPSYPLKLFDFGDTTYFAAKTEDDDRLSTVAFRNGEVCSMKLHTPLVIAGAAPAGGGTELERLNLLYPYFRVQFSADGEATEYHLPSSVGVVAAAFVDGQIVNGEYDADAHIFTFSEAPVKGENNVELGCIVSDDDTDYRAAFLKFCAMKHCEAYNGATDTRLFFYGDGTNVCYYTDTPMDGDGLYLPLGNEIRFDMSPTPITGMCRHSTQLMVFQQDCASSVVYEPVTLADGRITAGFYVRPVSRAVGNEMDAQVQTVNYPRTLCGGSLYEWRNSASYYQDERYAKRVSEKISKTLSKANPMQIVTCDDNPNKTYYMFLNDEKGTVLVNRYDLDAWTMYVGDVFKGIRYAQVFGNQMLFANKDTVFYFDEAADFDDPITQGGENMAIPAVWESGFMAFGADYLKKYASRIWLSLLPESNSELEVTVRTDKRDDYITKVASYSFLDFAKLDFGRFSFVTRQVPMVKRIQIKVKKFIYYKLIFRVSAPGCRATVLGYDQQVRYSSPVK